jgi:hypothetical protein
VPSSVVRKTLMLVGAPIIVMGSFFATLKVIDYWEAPPGTILIRSATYGGNCRASTGNATKSIATACDGKESCTYYVEAGKLGDPATGCQKNYLVEYIFRPYADPRVSRLAPEADGKPVRIACD